MSEKFLSQNLPALEKEILEFWRKNKIFEKSLAKKTPNGDFVFYDGPPFATGLPHYGHILASILKDVIPRYQTMKGKRVPRRWGWDCHGLPVEYEIEKELNLKSKKDIEKFGVEKFNEASRASVLRYADEWKKIIPRIGRWVDMENDYKTMDWKYTESIWRVFKTLFNKELVYEGYKSMHICPRCETPLANFELNQPGAYRDITDISVVVKFELIDESNTYILTWTTTPWTLPGNVALAINNEIIYCKIKIQNSKVKITNQNSKINEGEYFILAKNRLSILDKEWEYKIVEEFRGKDLIGKKYKPLFYYYANDKNLKNRENGWKIYPADFVSLEEGTGVVHIAPAFGEDDMNLAKEYDLPFIQHVSIDGKFKPEVKDFAGLSVKPKENHQSVDIEIIKYLAKENKLFKKEKIIHSYPHCWRCDTPLLNYATSSWFVKVTAIKDRLIANNKKINWIPSHIKKGRFGKWLEEARDWAISRSRFWGAPLPIWRCDKCGKTEIIGSLEDLKTKTKKSGNKYFVMRHGEAESNAQYVVSSSLKTGLKHPLTKKGKKQVLVAVKQLKKQKIDLIFSSDFRRSKETAKMAAAHLGFGKKKVIFDRRLREIDTGIFDGKSPKEYHDYFSSLEEKFYKTPPQGENLIDLKNRVAKFLYEINRKHSGKNILIVSHEYPIWLMFGAASGVDVEKSVEMKIGKPDFIKTGEIMELNFAPIPHNRNFELDLHRPHIDEVKLICDCGGQLKRIPEVFDCWFESGSMPYGQAHYPFENKKWFDKNFPAEFIAEGIDQTRGWFYTLLVLSTALFDKPAYKNVVVNGIILAEDGAKMSKRLKNYPDPMDLVNKYGADALRLYLLSSPAVKGENLNFSEKGVDEVYKKVILRLWNVYKFYELYGKEIKNQKSKIKITNQNSKILKLNILDRWIISRLNQLILEISQAMDKYELDRAARPINDFIDDLSTWYLRRSRERFKNEGDDKENAIAATRYVLLELSKIIAPFMPFMAETIYQSVRCQMSDVNNVESVHLENWPKLKPLISRFAEKLLKREEKLLEEMKEARKIVSLALEERAKARIKVRQPLASLRIKNQELGIKNQEEFLDLIKDEINVKEIIFDENIKNDFELDSVITAELKMEGHLRELIRIIQDLRKEAGYTPKDRAALYIETDDYFKRLIINNMENLKKDVGAKTVEFRRTDKFNAEEETKIDDSKIWLWIKKI